MDATKITHDFWQHKDRILHYPATAVVIKEEALVGGWCLQFDGGCRELGEKEQGAGGLIAWDAGGRYLGGAGRFYGL